MGRVSRRRRRLRSGRYARGELRAGITQWLWQQRRPLLPAVGLTLLAFLIAFVTAQTAFLRGVVVGAGVTFTTSLFLFAGFIGSGSARFLLGVLGEEATEELFSERARRRSGWRLINGVVINGRDIDHIAIGPAGVLAIETKWRSTERSSRDWSERARHQAADAARVVSNLIRQESDLSVEVTPALIEWGPGAPAESSMASGGVLSVSGKDLAPFAAWLDQDQIERDVIRRIAADLEAFLEAQLDRKART